MENWEGQLEQTQNSEGGGKATDEDLKLPEETLTLCGTVSLVNSSDVH